jgi:hypothetical protein
MIDFHAGSGVPGKATLASARRKLTTHQKAVLVQVLRTFPDERVHIVYSPSASDAQAYAEDFLSVFRAIGWDVSGPDATGESFATPFELVLIANDAGLPPCAEALRDALRIYGIEAKCSGSASVEAGVFILKVGQAHAAAEDKA